MDHEDAFAEEAQEEALLSEASTTDLGIETQFRMREDDGDDNESSPLMSPRRRRTQKTPYTRARASYQRAIDEPWSGAHGSHALPWYKKPSVCFAVLVWCKLLIVLDLLAPSCILPVLHSIWWSHCPKDISHPRPHLSRLPVRSCCKGP